MPGAKRVAARLGRAPPAPHPRGPGRRPRRGRRSPSSERTGARLPGALTPRARAALPWLAWLAVTFGLWNSCASHQAARQSEAALAHGEAPTTPARALAALRGAGTDDGDLARYRAYALATLGRPYPSFYLRPLAAWGQAEVPVAAGSEPEDPALAPLARPPRPLVPYRDFSVEYPPGFFLVALPPALPDLDLDHYALLFSLAMALLLTGALLAAKDLAATLAPAAAPSLLPLASLAALLLGTIAVRRFDAVVAASVCLTAWGFTRRRPLVAGLAFGVGVAAKGVPLVLAPLLLVAWGARRRWREAALASGAALAVGAAVGLPVLAVAGPRLFDLARYHGERPLQVESSGAALLALARLVDGGWARTVDSYGAYHVVGRGDGVLLWLSSVLPLAAGAGILAWAARGLRHLPPGPDGDRDAARLVVRAACATLAALMALGKVLSPQYLTWLLPAGALASVLDREEGDRSTARLLLAAMAATQLIHPLLYALSRGPHPLFGAVVLARNALLLAWALRLLRRAPATGQKKRAAPSWRAAPGDPTGT